MLAPDGRFLRANAAFSRMLGYSERELRRRTLNDMTFQDDAPDSARLFDGLQRGKLLHVDTEKRYVRKDGAVVWAHVVVTAVRKRGRLTHTIGVAVDITEKKRAESALHASREKYRALYTRTPAMMHSIDTEDRLIAVSDAWLAGLGYSREEVIGRRSVDFLTPDSRKRALEIILPSFFRMGYCKDVPYQFVKKDGGIIDVLLSGYGLRDDQGRVVQSLAVLNDVTERNRAEREVQLLLRELDERVRQRTSELAFGNAVLSAQSESSLDGILVVDDQERIVSRNRRFLELWSIPPELAAPGTVMDPAMRHAAAQNLDPAAFLAHCRGLRPRPNETTFHEFRLSGERTFEVYSSPIFSEDGRHLGRVFYYHDTTRRAQVEKLLRDSNAKLEVFAYAVSHDLKAPLRKMGAFGDILQARAADRLDAKELDMLQRIRKSATFMTRLIDDVLVLSRIGRDRLPLEAVDLGGVAKDILSDLEAPLAESGGEVELRPLPTVRGHASLLRRLLQNLLDNAIKFRAKDRPLRIVVGARDATDGSVEIYVQDNGIGFEPKFAEQIFEPFHRLNPVGDYEGSGIGLATCRRVAEEYGGRMTAEGAPGNGATFTLCLPASAVKPR